MLLGEQGCWHEHCNLLAAMYGGERCSQRDLGLAETDVAADNAIHRLVAAEVFENIVDRVRLVFGEFERKPRLEGAVVRFGPAEAMPRPRGAARVYIEQLRCDVADLSYGTTFCFGPLIAAEAMQRRVVG